MSYISHGLGDMPSEKNYGTAEPDYPNKAVGSALSNYPHDLVNLQGTTLETLDSLRITILGNVEALEEDMLLKRSRRQELALELARIDASIELQENMIAEFRYTVNKLDENATAFSKGTNVHIQKTRDRFENIHAQSQAVLKNDTDAQPVDMTRRPDF